jgi:hypothetical protein
MLTYADVVTIEVANKTKALSLRSVRSCLLAGRATTLSPLQSVSALKALKSVSALKSSLRCPLKSCEFSPESTLRV